MMRPPINNDKYIPSLKSSEYFEIKEIIKKGQEVLNLKPLDYYTIMDLIMHYIKV